MTDELKKQVFGKQEILRKIFESCGKMSLSDYVNSWPTVASSEFSVFYQEAEKLLKSLYPQELAEKAMAELKRFSLVSTIDHHGILNHPFFINSNLIFSLKKQQQYLICLSTAGVSLNNSSWPGCLLISDGLGNYKRFSFFPDAKKTQTVFSADAITLEGAKKVAAEINRDKGLSFEHKQKLTGLVNRVFFEKLAISQKNFSSQASVTTSLLWQEIFPGAPKVIYLPIEDLVANILKNFVCGDESNVLHKLFFTLEGQRLVEKYFMGSLGAFSGEHKGSFLFWGINNKGRRVHLLRDGGDIKGLGYLIKLKPKEIQTALENRLLYPSTLVCFLVLLYFQVTCLGGFNQVNWLTGIKEKFLGVLAELGETELLEKIKKVPTENFAEGNLAFLFQKDKIIKATGLDIYLSGQDLYPKYQKLAKVLTLGQSIESLLPEIYRVIVPAGRRDEELLGLTDLSIIQQNGYADLIKKILV